MQGPTEPRVLCDGWIGLRPSWAAPVVDEWRCLMLESLAKLLAPTEVDKAPPAQLPHPCCVRLKTSKLPKVTSARDAAPPYRPGELLSRALMQEISATGPTHSGFGMPGHQAAAEASQCEASPSGSPDDDDDDDDYSDSEEAYEDGQRPVPAKVDGQALNVGSTGHHLRLCKPCAFWNTKGCKDGKECKFCHLCEPGEKKRRKKEKSAYIRNISRWRTDTPTPPASIPRPGGPVGSPGRLGRG
eukprot:Skav232745  [mRNA]  locus=scaffold4478:20128:30975:+ [translate_table: standard]